MREEIEAVMAHHRLNSSPAAVAQFFKDTLGDRLVEYAPATASPGSGSHPRIAAGTGELAASDTRSSARLAGSASNSGTGSGSRPNLTGSRPGVGSGSGPRPAPAPLARAAVPGPFSAAAPSAEAASGAEAEEAKMKQAAGQQSRPSTGQRQALASGAGQGAQGQPPSSTRSGMRAVATGQPPAAAQAPMSPGPASSQRPAMAAAQAVAVASASQPGAQHPGTGARPAVPAPSSRVGMPSVAPAAIPAPVPARPAPVVSPPVAPTPAVVTAPPEPPPSRRWIGITVGSLAVVAVVAVVLWRVLGAGGGIEVVNLGPGERLYIGGLRVDGETHIEKPGALLVSTAVDGKLRRFGRTERRDRIDVRTIPEATAQPGTGLLKSGEIPLAAASRWARRCCRLHPAEDFHRGGQGTGCARHLSKRGLSTSVLAVPGQEVDIDLRQKK